MTGTATLPPPRARPRTPYLTLDQAGVELDVPAVVMHRHDTAVQAGDARPHSFPPVQDRGGQRVIARGAFDEFFIAPDGTPVIGYGLMATWFGVKDQTLRNRLRLRNWHIRMTGRPAVDDIPAPHVYVPAEYELVSGAVVERDEPKWAPAAARHWAQTCVYWLKLDGVTPTRPRRSGRPRERHPG